MNSTTIRSWSIERKNKPSIMIYQNTPSGIFSISDVEAKVTSDLEPIEFLCLSLMDRCKFITRVELKAMSGMNIQACQKILDDLEEINLVEQHVYDKITLFKNLEIIKKEVGEDWLNTRIERVLTRKVIKQFKLTKEGEKALKNEKKEITKPTTLNVLITGQPLYLMQSNIYPRQYSFDNVDMTPDLISQILEFSKKESTDIIPISLGSRSISEGKEVTTSQFWITIQANGEDDISKAHLELFITSRAFDKWAHPKWDDKIRDFMPSYKQISAYLIHSIAHTFEMEEEVIKESLTLTKDRITWELKCDLEMLHMIYAISPDPIKDIAPEITLKLPSDLWRLVAMIKLIEYDDLAEQGLYAARFHANASRAGFSLDRGFQTWSSIMGKWARKTKYKQYTESLKLLVKYDCLIEKLPDITTIIVDVENLLSFQRRGRQTWEFDRLRKIDGMLKENGIDDIIYHSPIAIQGKIDQEDELKNWIDDGKIIIFEEEDYETHPSIELARKKKAHYLGIRRIPKDDKFKDMRIYSKQIKFFVDKNRVEIPGLQPFYEFKIGNVLEKMYKEYYE